MSEDVFLDIAMREAKDLEMWIYGRLGRFMLYFIAMNAICDYAGLPERYLAPLCILQAVAAITISLAKIAQVLRVHVSYIEQLTVDTRRRT